MISNIAELRAYVDPQIADAAEIIREQTGQAPAPIAANDETRTKLESYFEREIFSQGKTLVISTDPNDINHVPDGMIKKGLQLTKDNLDGIPVIADASGMTTLPEETARAYDAIGVDGIKLMGKAGLAQISDIMNLGLGNVFGNLLNREAGSAPRTIEGGGVVMVDNKEVKAADAPTTDTPAAAPTAPAETPAAAASNPAVTTFEGARDWIAGKYAEFSKSASGADLNKDGKPDVAQFEKWIASQGENVTNMYNSAKTKISDGGRQVYDVVAPVAEEFGEKAGSFASKNGWMLGALVGGALLGALMGEGLIGILLLALIAGVAASLLGDGAGGFFGQMFGMGQDKQHSQGQGRALEPDPQTPAPTVDMGKLHVTEKGVAVEKGEVTRSVKDAEGHLQYQVTGKLSPDGTTFDVISMAAALPDGRMGNPVTLKEPVKLTVDGKGDVDLRAPVLTTGENSPLAQATVEMQKYAKLETLTLKSGANNEVTAEISGEKGPVLLKGTRVGDDAVQFTHAVAQNGDKTYTHPDGTPIEIELKHPIKLQVKEGTVSMMSGDIAKYAKNINDKSLEIQTTEQNELVARQEAEKTLILDTIKSAPDRNAAAVLFGNKLMGKFEDLGVDTNPAVLASSAIKDQYMDDDFRKKSPKEAAEIIANLPDVRATGVNIKPEIERLHESVSKGLDEKPAPQREHVPDGTNVTPDQPALGRPQVGHDVRFV